MINVESTILAQYANSPTLVALIKNMNQYIDPAADIQAFYTTVFNVKTATGFGLDVWGTIVNVSRNLQFATPGQYFGFDTTDHSSFAPFGQAPFYAGVAVNNTFTLSDDLYRLLILTKAVANITRVTPQAINQLLRNIFTTSTAQRAYLTDLGSMAVNYVFEFPLTAYQYAVLTQSGVIPRAAGVQTYTMQITPSATFGFNGQGQPFGQGTFGSQPVVIP
jgi:hypothetical protein